MKKEIVCIVCPNGCLLQCCKESDRIEVVGNTCPKGLEYAITELTAPMRTLTTSVATTSPHRPVLPVRTDGAIPKGETLSAMQYVNSIKVDAPKTCGDVICENFMGFGVNLIATDDLIYK